jgi:hypothetical protein
MNFKDLFKKNIDQPAPKTNEEKFYVIGFFTSFIWVMLFAFPILILSSFMRQYAIDDLPLTLTFLAAMLSWSVFNLVFLKKILDFCHNISLNWYLASKRSEERKKR